MLLEVAGKERPPATSMEPAMPDPDLGPLIDALDGAFADLALCCGSVLTALAALGVYSARNLVDMAVEERDDEAREVLAVIDRLVADGLADGLAGRPATPGPALH
jgi:hypothetical protein